MFLQTFHPSPIIFQFGPINIYWYGLLIVIAILIGLGLTFRLARAYSISKEKIWNLFFYLIVFGLIGARAFHFFYNFFYYWKDPLAIFRVWEGGLSIHGAIVGGIIVILLHCFIVKKQDVKQQKKNIVNDRKNDTQACHPGSQISIGLIKPVPSKVRESNSYKQAGYLAFANRRLSFWLLADLLAPALVLGQTIGRWGNYFNQELYGRPTSLPWAIPIDLINRTEGFSAFAYFHPIFLYESIWCFIIFLILLFLHKQRIKKFSLENKKHYYITEYSSETVIRSGFIFLIYLALYSLGRFFIEFLRIDPQPIFFTLRLGQWFSLILIVVVLIISVNRVRWNKAASGVVKRAWE